MHRKVEGKEKCICSGKMIWYNRIKQWQCENELKELLSKQKFDLIQFISFYSNIININYLIMLNVIYLLYILFIILLYYLILLVIIIINYYYYYLFC